MNIGDLISCFIGELFIERSLSIVIVIIISASTTYLGYTFFAIIESICTQKTSRCDLFELSKHLNYSANLPSEAHLNYAKLLTPSLCAYLTTQLVSNSLANENMIFQLQNETNMQTINRAELLKKEVLSSKLSDEAKQHLIDKIDEIVLKNLGHAEVK
ncbi:MAG: hypothetical protein ACD_58C00297G0003 [uncultured bacterium]|nr:MAG: hypothetical protein ACD_58C00297G0003 [uncultured bacterium]